MILAFNVLFGVSRVNDDELTKNSILNKEIQCQKYSKYTTGKLSDEKLERTIYNMDVLNREIFYENDLNLFQRIANKIKSLFTSNIKNTNSCDLKTVVSVINHNQLY